MESLLAILLVLMVPALITFLPTAQDELADDRDGEAEG
jgi:hypothetical protein